MRLWVTMGLALMVAAPAHAGKVRCGPVWVDEDEGCCNYGCGYGGDMCIAPFCQWGRPQAVVSRDAIINDPYTQVTLDVATAFGDTAASSLGLQQYIGHKAALSARVDARTDGAAAAGIGARVGFGRWMPDIAIGLEWAPKGSVRTMGSPAVNGAFAGARLAAGVDISGITGGLGLGVYRALGVDTPTTGMVADAHLGWTYDLKTYHYIAPLMFRIQARPWLATDGMRPGLDGTLGIWYRVRNNKTYSSRGMLRFGVDVERRFAGESDQHIAMALRLQFYPEANY